MLPTSLSQLHAQIHKKEHAFSPDEKAALSLQACLIALPMKSCGWSLMKLSRWLCAANLLLPETAARTRLFPPPGEWHHHL